MSVEFLEFDVERVFQKCLDAAVQSTQREIVSITNYNSTAFTRSLLLQK